MCVQMYECYNGEGIHFDGVEWRLRAYLFLLCGWYVATN